MPYPEFEALVEEWKATASIEARCSSVSSRMQQLFNAAPTSIPLHYPSGEVAYRPEAYDGRVEPPGYGLMHECCCPGGGAAGRTPGSGAATRTPRWSPPLWQPFMPVTERFLDGFLPSLTAGI